MHILDDEYLPARAVELVKTQWIISKLTCSETFGRCTLPQIHIKIFLNKFISK